jgi:glutamate-1-semialdehyde 2,1-aminomutase
VRPQPQKLSLQEDLLALATRYLPGGSTWQWSLPPDVTFIVDRGHGSRLYDTDGREYIDLAMGSGPLLLGHAHPSLVKAVQEQVAKGSQYHWLSEPMVRLAEAVCQAVPCGDKVRFCSTGTEATMLAIRVARVFTRREKVLKFDGAWHGLHDYALISNPNTDVAEDPCGQPDVGGIPKGVLETILVGRYNDVPALEKVLARHGSEIAAVIVEPLQRAIPPQLRFLQRLRELTSQQGIVLIFDEVVTGFRLAYGGAQSFYGVTADLATYGKALTCGFSLGAICGRSEYMETANPSRKGTMDYACLSGTLSGNPIACAAGAAALAELRRPGVYDRLATLGQRLRDGMVNIASELSVPLQALGAGSIAQPVFIDQERQISSASDLQAADAERATRVRYEMIRRGVFVVPDMRMFVSLAHSQTEIDSVLSIFADAIRATA